MKKLIATIIIVLTAIIYVLGSFTTIPAGHRGIVTRMGRVTGQVLPEGFSLKCWVDNVTEIEVRTVKEQLATEGASKDLQTVHTEVAVNLHVDPAGVSGLFQTIGPDYMNRAVAPAIQESTKATLAQYTAEELVTKREQVRAAIKELIYSKLQPLGIDVTELNIVNFDFSASFNASIEAKVTAEQHALAAKNKLTQIEFEAQQKVVEAEGKAKAMAVESGAMTNSPQILQLRAIEKWDGKLPTMMGNGPLPFIQVGK